jgi:hypothetical protein
MGIKGVSKGVSTVSSMTKKIAAVDVIKVDERGTSRKY